MITITFSAWMIPTFITIASIVWALFIYDDGGGYLTGMGNVFMLIPALAISLVSWIGYAIAVSIFL